MPRFWQRLIFRSGFGSLTPFAFLESILQCGHSLPDLLADHGTADAGSQTTASYVMKENEILHAIRKVLAGEVYFSERLGASLVRRSLEQRPDSTRVGVEKLSDRELQVFH